MERFNILKNNFFNGSLIVLLTFIIYSGSLNNEFVYDDEVMIQNNQHIDRLPDLINNLFNKKYFLVSQSSTYRPVPVLSYFLGYSLFGQNTTGYHIFAILTHAINGILLFILLLKLSGNRLFSFGASLLFITHPAISEAIYEITYNDDTIPALFCLVGLIIYISPRKKLLPFSYLAFILALFSKEMAISLPLILILYDLLLNKSFQPFRIKERVARIFKARILIYSGFFLIDISYIILRFYHNKIYSPMFRELSIFPELGKRIIYIPYEIFQFIKITFFPFILNADRMHHYPSNFFSLENVISIIVFAVLIYCAIRFFYKKHILVFGILWYLITLGPVLNIIPLIHPVADRYLYFPIIGFCIALSFVIFYILPEIKLLQKWSSFNLNVSVLLLAVVLYSVRTYARDSDWKNSMTLWEQTIKYSPESHRAIGNLGIEYFKQGQREKAKDYFRKVIGLDSTDSRGPFNLGVAYFYEDSLYQAIGYFRKALQLDSQYIDAHYYLGQAYSRLGNYKDAFNEWNTVLAIDPANRNALESIKKTKAILDKYK